MTLDPVFCQVDDHIRHVQEVVGDLFLDQIALLAAANQKSCHSASRSWIWPQNQLSADLDHGLGTKLSLLEESRSKDTRRDHSFHSLLFFWLSGGCRLTSRQACSASAAGRTGLSKNCLAAFG